MTTSLPDLARDRVSDTVRALGPAWAAAGALTSLLLALQVLGRGWPIVTVPTVLAAVGCILLTGAAVALARTRPGAALALAWGSALCWTTAALPVLTAQLALGVVAFACARWGTRGELAAAVSSVPLAALVVGGGYAVPALSGLAGLAGGALPLAGAGPALVGLLVVGVVGLLGLAPVVAGAVGRRTARSGARSHGDTVAP